MQIHHWLITNQIFLLERQLAEGIDNDSETFNNNNDGGGGGGGDGSSGPEDEMGGDGGVLIRSELSLNVHQPLAFFFINFLM